MSFVYSPPANCADGMQNQGEAGVDCGGPCSTPCPLSAPITPNANDNTRLPLVTAPPTNTVINARVQSLTLTQTPRTVSGRRLYFGSVRAVVVDANTNKPIPNINLRVTVRFSRPAPAKAEAQQTCALTKSGNSVLYSANALTGTTAVDSQLRVCVLGIALATATKGVTLSYVPSRNVVTCVTAGGQSTKNAVLQNGRRRRTRRGGAASL